MNELKIQDPIMNSSNSFDKSMELLKERFKEEEVEKFMNTLTSKNEEGQIQENIGEIPEGFYQFLMKYWNSDDPGCTLENFLKKWTDEYQRIDSKWDNYTNTLPDTKDIEAVKKKMTLSPEDGENAFCPQAPLILGLLSPFLSKMAKSRAEMTKRKKEGLAGVFKLLKVHFDTKKEEIEELKKSLKVDKLLIVAMSLNVPIPLVSEYNAMLETDPRFISYFTHPVYGYELRKFGVLLDRWDTSKEVICSVVWSTHQKVAVFYPKAGIHPFPTCWKCDEKFGTFSCGDCRVAKYCSKECQVEDWKKHKPQCIECTEMAKGEQILIL